MNCGKPVTKTHNNLLTLIYVETIKTDPHENTYNTLNLQPNAYGFYKLQKRRR